MPRHILFFFAIISAWCTFENIIEHYTGILHTSHCIEECTHVIACHLLQLPTNFKQKLLDWVKTDWLSLDELGNCALEFQSCRIAIGLFEWFGWRINTHALAFLCCCWNSRPNKPSYVLVNWQGWQANKTTLNLKSVITIWILQ